MEVLKNIVAASPLATACIVSIIVVIVLSIIIWAMREGREVSFWPPKIGARASLQPSTALVPRVNGNDIGTATPVAEEVTEWYTEWLLSGLTHRETLTLRRSADGTVTGRRWTESGKGTMKYAVVGYSRGDWFWLEYHDPEKLGGGTIQLRSLPAVGGMLQGIITYPHCNTGRQLCVANQWVSSANPGLYDPKSRVELASAY